MYLLRERAQTELPSSRGPLKMVTLWPKCSKVRVSSPERYHWFLRTHGKEELKYQEAGNHHAGVLSGMEDADVLFGVFEYMVRSNNWPPVDDSICLSYLSAFIKES